MSCWLNAGHPWVDNPIVREAAIAIGKVYDHNCVGGYLHIVVDDWNVEDDDLEICRKYLDTDEGEESAASLAAQRYCLGILDAMSVDERWTALVIHEGYKTQEAAMERIYS